VGRQIPVIVSPVHDIGPVVETLPLVARQGAPAPQTDLAPAELREHGSPLPQLPAAKDAVSETIHIFVKQGPPRRDGSRRVVMGSGLARAQVSYSVRDCPLALRGSALTPCKVTTRGPEEARFFKRVFHWRGSNKEVDSVKALQTALGLPGPPDGKWGPRSRAAWLARALKPDAGALSISLPGSGTAAVLFEKESRP